MFLTVRALAPTLRITARDWITAPRFTARITGGATFGFRIAATPRRRWRGSRGGRARHWFPTFRRGHGMNFIPIVVDKRSRECSEIGIERVRCKTRNFF